MAGLTVLLLVILTGLFYNLLFSRFTVQTDLEAQSHCLKADLYQASLNPDPKRSGFGPRTGQLHPGGLPKIQFNLAGVLLPAGP